MHTRGVHRRRLPIPPGSSVIQVSYLSEQVGVSPLPLHEFLWFAEQVCNSLYHSWVWTLVFALTNSCLCRRGGLLRGEHRFRCALVLLLTSSTIGGGGGGCNIFVPVSGGNGTKISSTGDIFDQPPGQMRRIWGELTDHVGDHVVSSPEGAVMVTSPGTKSSYPRPPQLLNPSFSLFESMGAVPQVLGVVSLLVAP